MALIQSRQLKYTLFLKNMITHQKDFNDQEDDEICQSQRKAMHKIVEDHLLSLMKDEKEKPEDDQDPSCMQDESAEESQQEDEDGDESQDNADDESEDIDDA